MTFSSSYRPSPKPSVLSRKTSTSPAPRSVNTPLERQRSNRSSAPKATSKTTSISPVPKRRVKPSFTAPTTAGKTDVPVEIYVPQQRKGSDSSSEEDNTPVKRRGALVESFRERTSPEAVGHAHTLPLPPPREPSRASEELEETEDKPVQSTPAKEEVVVPVETSETKSKYEEEFTKPRFSVRTPSAIIDLFASSTPKRSFGDSTEFVTPLPVSRITLTPTVATAEALKASSQSPTPTVDNVVESMSASAEKRCCRRPSPPASSGVSLKRTRTPSPGLGESTVKRPCGCSRSRSLLEDGVITKRSPSSQREANQTSNLSASCKACTPSPSLTPVHVITSVEVAVTPKREAVLTPDRGASLSPAPTEKEIAQSVLSSAERKRCARPSREPEAVPLVEQTETLAKEASPCPSQNQLLDSLRNSAKKPRAENVSRGSQEHTPSPAYSPAPTQEQLHSSCMASANKRNIRKSHSGEGSAPALSVPPALRGFSPSPAENQAELVKCEDRSCAQERIDSKGPQSAPPQESSPLPQSDPVGPSTANQERSNAQERPAQSERLSEIGSPSVCANDAHPNNSSIKEYQDRCNAMERPAPSERLSEIGSPSVCANDARPNSDMKGHQDRSNAMERAASNSQKYSGFHSFSPAPTERRLETTETVPPTETVKPVAPSANPHHESPAIGESQQSSKVFYDCVSAGETPRLPSMPKQFSELEKFRDSFQPKVDTSSADQRKSAVIVSDTSELCVAQPVQQLHVPVTAVTPKREEFPSPVPNGAKLSPLPLPVPLSSQVPSYKIMKETPAPVAVQPEVNNTCNESEILVTQTPSTGKKSGRRSQLEDLLDMLPADIAEEVRCSEQLVTDSPNRASFASDVSSISERVSRRSRSTFFDMSSYSKYLDEMNKASYESVKGNKKRKNKKRNRTPSAPVPPKTAKPVKKAKAEVIPVQTAKRNTKEASTLVSTAPSSEVESILFKNEKKTPSLKATNNAKGGKKRKLPAKFNRKK
ncbi:hypothetical protein, conserved [Angomonas deanei]|uniref:Uncharacterized protein n=1 Tax=Angomonas deanei TaxID=59799 RepID=A0A7G2CA54_9TRYP|nr:hypothetical protein, conserved [Angomonas deanei]